MSHVAVSSFFNQARVVFCAPYEEGMKQFRFAIDGKVEHAAQRIFSEDRSSTQLSFKERVFHIGVALALLFPIINMISYYFLVIK